MDEAADYSDDMLFRGIAAHLGDARDRIVALVAWSLVHDWPELLLNRQVAQPANDWTLVAMVDAVLWNLFV